MNQSTSSSVLLTRRALLHASAASLGAGVAGLARASETLRIVCADPYPPYVWADGVTTKGVLVDILDELVGKQPGMTLSHEAMAWQRGQDQVKKGEADGFGCSVTEERKQYANFGAEPLVHLRYAVFSLKINKRAAEIKKIASLEDMKAFSQGDFMGSGYAANNFKSLDIDWAPNLEQVFRKVAAGHNDILIASDMVGPWTMRKLGLSDQFAMEPMSFLPASGLYLGIRKSYSGGEALLRQLDVAVMAANADGTVKAIEAKYL
jgi:polar amino acid transport system substrate-binding protein